MVKVNVLQRQDGSLIPQPAAEMIAQRLRVIGDTQRIRILDLLRDNELSVLQITEALELTQQNASRHLGVLRDAGIVARRKEGVTAYYRVIDSGVFDLCEQVCGALEDRINELTASLEGASDHGK